MMPDPSRRHTLVLNLAHLKNTTSTPPQSSSTIIDWVEQLPTPPQVHRSPQQALASISANAQRLPENSSPTHYRKRRALSPILKGQHSQPRNIVESEPTKRRSARLVSLRSEMDNKKAKPNARPAGQSNAEQASADNPGHVMTTRGRSGTLTPSIFNGAPIPHLQPATPSRKSGSPGRASNRSPKSQSPSRLGTDATSSSKGITKKEQLEQMEPTITFSPIRAIKDPSIPESVKAFWSYIGPAQSDDQVLPEELKKPLEDLLNTPTKTKRWVNPSHFKAQLFNSNEIEHVLRLVTTVVDSAEDHRENSQEPQWVTQIVGYLLTELQRLSLLVSAAGKRIEATDISQVSIAPIHLCPTSPYGVFSDANKKVDRAFAFVLSTAERLAVTKAFKESGNLEPASINQTQCSMTAMKAMFAYFEFKVDARDPLIQLAAFIGADFEKRSIEGYPMEIPVAAIAVYGDSWRLYVVYAIKLTTQEKMKDGKSYRVQFLGPVEIGSTFSVEGVFRILHVMKALARWGFEVYEPQYLKKVLAKYGKK